MTHYVYIVRCADGSLYTGWTTDLEKRIEAHNSSGAGAKYTRSRRPVALVYHEELDTINEAQSREYAIKQLSRDSKLELIAQKAKDLSARKAPRS